MLLANRYQLTERLNKKSGCLVYKGINLITKEEVVIKLEAQDNELKLLKNESKIYYYLKHVKGVLPIKWYGSYQKYIYFVLPFINTTLSDAIEDKFFQNDVKRCGRLMNNLLQIMKSIHDKHLIHRDIKPDNILIRSVDELYVIDFGFAKQYIKNGTHIEIVTNRNCIIGTMNYISINVHNMIEPSRRDDVESLIYVVIAAYYGGLPWEKSSCDSICMSKQRFLSGTNDDPFVKAIKHFFENLVNLNFEDEPNYTFVF
jgi:serine/threonine protein kinase